ncbi:MAG: GNAT family N-acetyltransferase [Peptostreptococcaceae bacterium]
MIELLHVTEENLLDEVKELFLEYADLINIDLSFYDFQKEFNELPRKYLESEGILIIALVDNKTAGCIGLRPISDNICEIKKLFVRDEFRGLGVGKELINRIIEEGNRLGYEIMRLDTLPNMEYAQELYKQFGFYTIEPYTYNPIRGTKFMELNLKNV